MLVYLQLKLREMALAAVSNWGLILLSGALGAVIARVAPMLYARFKDPPAPLSLTTQWRQTLALNGSMLAPTTRLLRLKQIWEQAGDDELCLYITEPILVELCTTRTESYQTTGHKELLEFLWNLASVNRQTQIISARLIARALDCNLGAFAKILAKFADQYCDPPLEYISKLCSHENLLLCAFSLKAKFVWERATTEQKQALIERFVEAYGVNTSRADNLVAITKLPGITAQEVAAAFADYLPTAFNTAARTGFKAWKTIYEALPTAQQMQIQNEPNADAFKYVEVYGKDFLKEFFAYFSLKPKAQPSSATTASIASTAAVTL